MRVSTLTASAIIKRCQPGVSLLVKQNPTYETAMFGSLFHGSCPMIEPATQDFGSDVVGKNLFLRRRQPYGFLHVYEFR
jgi:hypothetical protein